MADNSKRKGQEGRVRRREVNYDWTQTNKMTLAAIGFAVLAFLGFSAGMLISASEHGSWGGEGDPPSAHSEAYESAGSSDPR